MTGKEIFDYNPTATELKELFSYDESENTMVYGFSILPLPIKDYHKETSSEEKLLDLAILFEFRGQIKEARKLWAEIPDIARQYHCGFDNVQIPE